MQANALDFLQLLDGQRQYVVPRWQRRYRWGEADIERLVDDLVSVGSAEENGAAHYGGTLLTFPEPRVPGVIVERFRVVDGQQRLTTVSILLACIARRIAEELGSGGDCEGWTAENIRNDRLLNPGKSPDLRRKLRLQNEDEEDYRRFLEGKTMDGPGAVPQACRIARRLVARNDPGQLLRGLQRFRVVGVYLQAQDDPQQIFECLNATGRPLTESEQVKNWLLMGLDDETQQRLHDHGWLRIEEILDAKYGSEPIDLFLRDLLRWKRGKIVGLRRVYEEFRRWVRLTGRQDRTAVCRELVEYARLYGHLTGTNGPHKNPRVEVALRHLRALDIEAHRPLTLRLLHEASPNGDSQPIRRTSRGPARPRRRGGEDELERAIEAVGAWLTRLWLADRPLNGVNRAATDLASGPGPEDGEPFADYWLGRIRRLRHTGVAVPTDEQVAEGIRTRKAYGGHASRASMAVLCALMEAERPDEATARDSLSLEHIMPQKLTATWRHDLAERLRVPGGDVAEFHGRSKNLLPNLTLSGDATNTRLSARPFAEKRKIYADSPIGMTRRLGHEEAWDDEAMERRAEDLASRVLDRWPWTDPNPTRPQTMADDQFRWRKGDGPWRSERTASGLTLNVAAALLDADPANADQLSGQAISRNVHPSSLYPPGTKVGSLTAQQIPGHDYVLCPSGDHWQLARFCEEMARRCGAMIAIELPRRTVWTREFWQLLREETGGVPGQSDNWLGANQGTKPLNSLRDSIGLRAGVLVAETEQIRLYARAPGKSPGRVERLRSYSYRIREIMGDQETDGVAEPRAKQGLTIAVVRPFSLSDEDGWPEAVHWIHEQCKRLEAIVSD